MGKGGGGMNIAEALAIGPRLAARYAPMPRSAIVVLAPAVDRPTIRKRRQRRRVTPQRGRRYKTEAEAAAARRLWWQERARRTWAEKKAKRLQHASAMKAAGLGVRMRRMRQRKPVTAAEMISRA